MTNIAEVQRELREELDGWTTKPASIGYGFTASASTTNLEEIPIDFEHYIVSGADVYIESGAGVDTQARLVTDNNKVAPAKGWLSGGGTKMEVHSSYYLANETLYVEYDNAGASDYQIQIVVHGRYVE